MITVIANLKGGTGKSTVSFNLAIWLASRDQNVCLYDLDPQATLSDVIEIRQDESYRPDITVTNKLDGIESKAEQEIIIDVGTSDMQAFNQAIKIADRIIVPIPPSQADVWSTQRFMNIIKNNFTDHSDAPNIFGFVNRADTHHAVRETEEAAIAIQQIDDIEFIDSPWYQRTIYRRAFSEGMAVFELDPNSKAAAEVNQLASILYADTHKAAKLH